MGCTASVSPPSTEDGRADKPVAVPLEAAAAVETRTGPAGKEEAETKPQGPEMPGPVPAEEDLKIEEHLKKEEEERVQKEKEASRQKDEEERRIREEAQRQKEEEQRRLEEARLAQIEREVKEDEEEQETGKVFVKYNHYRKDFDILGGRLVETDFFSLSYALKGAKLHLTDKKTTGGEIFKLTERAGKYKCYNGLQNGVEYFVIVEPSAANNNQLAEDRKRREKELAERAEYEKLHPPVEPDNEDKSSCSCVWGNPCVDKYLCLDWENREFIAKKNRGRSGHW